MRSKNVELIPFEETGEEHCTCRSCTNQFEGLRVIRAINDIPARNVKAGDLGARIPAEADIELWGDGWIDALSIIKPTAYITGTGLVAGSTIWGWVSTSGSVIDSWVFKGAEVIHEASCKDAAVSGVMKVDSTANKCVVKADAVLGEGMHVTDDRQIFVLGINGGMNITAVLAPSGTVQIQAGCQRFDLDKKTDVDLKELAIDNGWPTYIINPVQIMMDGYFKSIASLVIPF